jgi:hypothetical protein
VREPVQTEAVAVAAKLVRVTVERQASRPALTLRDDRVERRFPALDLAMRDQPGDGADPVPGEVVGEPV